MPYYSVLAGLVAAIATPLVGAVSSQSYAWKNVKIGGGGGFVPGIVFNPTQQGLAYARTDIGGAYRLNPSNDTWTPLLDFANDATWNYWGVAALATDPVQTNRLYLACGGYTNDFDPNNGNILISTDSGSTFTASPLPFKVGGNMPGRGKNGANFRANIFDNRTLTMLPQIQGEVCHIILNNFVLNQIDSVLPLTPTVTEFFTLELELELVYGNLPTLASIAWVTFDSTSGTSGSPTPRIFVGVANLGSTNIYMSTNAGATWSAVPGQNTTYLPHKGVLSPVEKVLYVSYSNGAGPYDGTLGSVMKYNLTSSVWTDITPVSGSDLYFGFGGVAVDLKTPGTIMVAALNSWWPDGQIYRSTNGGATWSPLWDWLSYPTMDKYYTYSDSLAPWIGVGYTEGVPGTLQIGWMMEALVIDPFDSNHWLYGTGETIYGGHNLKTWDTTHNVSISSLADGIEETSVQALISPPTGANLISALGDIQGFVHNSLTSPPSLMWTNPQWSTTADLDYAGNVPNSIVRIGTGDSTSGKQVAISNDGGNTWSQDFGAADNVEANADTVLWRTNGQGVMVSQFTNPFAAVPSLPADAVIASDKLNNSVFYGANANSFYLSTNGGQTFTVTSSLGSSNVPAKIVVNPKVSGDVWVSTDVGLFHSTTFGKTFTAIPGITEAWAIALGAPQTATSYPAIFAAASITGRRLLQEYSMAILLERLPPPTSTVSSTTTSVKSTTTVSSSTTVKSTSTTTTVKSTTTISSTTTSSAPASTATQTGFGQCGGQGWTGPTLCASGACSSDE
ncbi:Carbohydrate-binding module family 1 protein [Mycena sanguinolenta]|uniref:Carbohydrate-binding module family 1 protein n=1 Tax=Mycena sanguinolenta TaxID=230812 RepID=A0A8H6XEL4_9AGAR|nr:Carbohydrate-binding module family 1 protein [Mycena sanguinolenta]